MRGQNITNTNILPNISSKSCKSPSGHVPKWEWINGNLFWIHTPGTNKVPWIPCFEIHVNKSLKVSSSHWLLFYKGIENSLIKFFIKEHIIHNQPQNEQRKKLKNKAYSLTDIIIEAIIQFSFFPLTYSFHRRHLITITQNEKKSLNLHAYVTSEKQH